MADTVKLDALAVAAHPDDIEITCGGLLIKLGAMGRKIGALDLSKGEMGTYGTEADRSREAAASAKVMGLAYRHNLELPDAAIEYGQANKLKIAQIIRDTRPELVILPHWAQRHPDHHACSRLGYDACYLAGLKKVDLAGEPHRPRKIIYVSYFRNTDYSFLVDISEHFERKLEAVASYESQFGDSGKIKDLIKRGVKVHELIEGGEQNIFHPGVNIYDLMYTRARHLGQLVDVKFAEAYTIREQILVDDPQKMPMRSI